MLLKINGRTERLRSRTIDFFNDVNINLRYDSVASTFSFSCYFNPNNQDHKELFHVGHYHTGTIEHNGQLLITGFILSQTFQYDRTKQMASFGGYSLPGVLEDCQIPTEQMYTSDVTKRIKNFNKNAVNLNYQSDNLTLKQIAEKLAASFGINITIDSSVADRMSNIYDKTTSSETQSVKSYLTELATQKNIIISHNEIGNLVFTETKKKSPIFNFEGQGSPDTSMSLSFNGQSMHSHIRVIKEVSAFDGNAGDQQVSNPYVPFVFRPKVSTQNSGDDNDTSLAAQMLLAEELKNIKLTINLSRWDINGKVVTPNNFITVINPEIFLYKKSTWFIESVTLTGNEKQQIAVLNCVLPEVYTGGTPQYIF